MANCGFKIIKNGSNFVVGINHDESSFSDTTYALSVNGLAAFYGNPRILGVQYPGFIYHTRATNSQAVGEQFVVCVTSGNYYSPRYQAFRTYTYNSSTGAANSSYHETFMLPTVNAGRTNSSEFSILTSKSAVTIAQGGTGKTTATEAWKALGGGASGKHADSYFALADHNHAAGDITSGTLGVARGGTGVTANPSMLTNLASTTAAGVFAASPRPGVTGILPVANGGTGASAAEAGTITYTTNSHIASVAALSVYRVGKMGVLLATGQTLKAYGVSSYVGVGTIAAGWRPKVEVTQRVPLASGNWILRITTGGVIQFNKSTTETGTFYTTMVFPIA